jgi:hypothetical protein
MNEDQVKWAEHHDWFLWPTTGGVLVESVCTLKDGTTTKESLNFTDFRALREWAGY